MTENDNNRWPGLAKLAGQGGLELTPGAAREGAKRAAAAANALTYAKNCQEFLTKHTGFSDNGKLDQILILKRRFNDQATALGTILDHYTDLVNAMADTMIQADKTYDAAEKDSKTRFNDLKNSGDAADPDATKPGIVTGKIPDLGGDGMPRVDQDKKGHPDLYNIAHERGHYDAIDPENPYSHDDLDWFYEAGQGMHPQTVADFGATWTKVAEKVDKTFDALTKQLTAMVDNKDWSSAGAQSAVDAANTFKTQASELTDDLRAMGTNLNTVSGWLANTKIMMPQNKPTDFDYEHYDRMERIIKAAQLAFHNWYVPGLIGASQSVPRLGDPTAPKPKLDGPDPRSKGGGDHRGGGDGGSNKFAPGGGPGAHAQVPQPRKVDTDPNKTDPKKTNPDGTHPGGTDPNGKNPHGGDSNGKDPNGKDPNGTNPNGSNPDGTNPNSSTSGQSGQGMSQLSSALQQGMQGLSSLQNTNKKQQDLKDQLKDSPLANLLNDLKSPGGGGPGGGGPGGVPEKPAALQPANSRLFPRAAVAEGIESATGVASRAGVASGSGMGGMGGGMGGMGHGGGGAHGAGGKEHKRPEFLDSSEHLDEAMGTAPIVAKPVVEG
ncbi:hypothetical protein [Nocardia concava]|uniref:hypothetical protein n=1 Tax=Nocardia concava TaxID=257281 RepID=UPI0002EF917D|nr:hypothetical protein [Nocardia concava]